MKTFMKTIEDTPLLCVRIGDRLRIKGDSRIGQLIDIQLSPNGRNDPTIVAVLTIKLFTGAFSATSNHFEVVKGEEYLERIYK